MMYEISKIKYENFGSWFVNTLRTAGVI